MSKQILATTKAPGAIGPYSQGTKKQGTMVFTSGQLPINVETGLHEKEDIKKATAQCIENVKFVLEQGGATLNDVCKIVIFLSDMALFKDMNEVYGKYFTENCPARSCVQVAKLPLEAIVEIEAIAIV